MPACHIFFTGGVVSSLGKGLTLASLGLLLERRGFKVALHKLDPYLNIDPGTMSPCEHGEVYVLQDGTETDLDLGHYERFCAARLDKRSSTTMGRIYQEVLSRERQGDYLGQTVQVIPHVTDAIKEAIKRLDTPGVDLVLTEVGGTAGDIEGLPVLEAVRQLAHQLGPEQACVLHLTLLPHLKAAGELKTKPTQQSVALLRQIGIQPDFLLCRTEKPDSLSAGERDKIALFCNVPARHVLEVPDVASVCQLRLRLAQAGLDGLVCERLGLGQLAHSRPLDIEDWKAVAAAEERRQDPDTPCVSIALIGKYRSRDAYKSIDCALQHASCCLALRLEVDTLDAEAVESWQEKGTLAEELSCYHGILIPGGFGVRGFEGKVAACRYAREERVPYLGICLGLQVAVVELARNGLGLAGASSQGIRPAAAACCLPSQIHASAWSASVPRPGRDPG